MRNLMRTTLMATLAIGLTGAALAATAPADCTAGLHLGQASHPVSSQERLNEYLEFHADVTQSNGPSPLLPRPAGPRGTN